MYDEIKKIRIICVVFAVLSALAAVFRIFILKNYVEESNGLYTSATAGNLFLCAAAVLVIIPVIISFALKWNEKDRKPLFKTTAVRIGAFVCALAFSALTVYYILNTVKTMKLELLPTACMILALLSALYFAFAAFGKERFSPENSLFPTFPAIYTACAVISAFLDVNTQINASDRSFTMLAMVLAMYFFICEAEYSVMLRNDEKNAKYLNARERRFFAAGVMTFSVIIAVCVPQLVCEKNYGAEFLRNMLLVSFGLYAFVRTAKL
jgi:hypothetical protein